MSEIIEETRKLRDGRSVRFAQIEPHHAGAYCDYMLSLASESPWSGTVVEEVRSESDQRERFEQTINSGCTWNLGVFENSTDQMIGDCSWTRPTHVKFAHVASLGIGIRDGWRGVGLGRMMMESAISAARADERVEKLELGVFAKNEIARNLYRSLGFAEEAQRIRAVRQLDGSYDDDIGMGLWVGS